MNVFEKIKGTHREFLEKRRYAQEAKARGETKTTNLE